MTETVVRELGLRFPDGTIAWGGLSGSIMLRVGAANISVSLVDEGPAREHLVSLLSRRAEDANLDAGPFLGLHDVVERVTTTVVSEPLVVAGLADSVA